MKPNKENPGKILDQAIVEIRNAPVSEEAIAQAAANVRQRLQEEYYKVLPYPSAMASGEVDRIESCEDFRALIPAYLTVSLTPSRRLLFEDHIRECVGCRKALETARRGSSATSGTSRAVKPAKRANVVKWIAPIAAALLMAVALQFPAVRDLVWPIDVHAVVQMVDGGLFRLSGHDAQGIKVGQRIERGEAVRTGAASGAMLELADGTRVEMASKSELSLVRARDGVKIKLARGNVIVTAAKQHGHLYVETVDCNVSVVGTVFSVSSTIKGSRVAVIEGEVLVEEQGGTEESLFPGEQTYTNPAMGAVPIDEEIGWSRNAEALLKELQTFGQDFASRAERESMRHTSRLVGLMPADTVVFASLPNASQHFKDSYALFRQRVGENAGLSAWWREAESTSTGIKVDELANRIAEVGAYLGTEVLVAFPKGDGAPLIIAEAARPDVLVSALEGDLRRLAETGQDSGMRLARNSAELAALSGTTAPVIYVDDGLMIVSSVAQVQRTAAIHRGTVTNAFSGTPLYRRLEQAYTEGVGWLLAVDLQQTLTPGDVEAQQLGFENVQQLVLEQKTGIGSAASQVALGFSQQRRGLPAWLGAPAPMGALDFVSSDAYGFSAWITKDPELILDDVLGLGQAEIAEQLRRLEESHGINLRRDLAEPLGNEALIALDGPVLPKPSWKLVFEVNNAPRLENTIQWAVTNVNRELQAQGQPLLNLTSETVDGKTYHALTSTAAPMEIHYTSWMGYMIVAPSRALVAEAIRIHDTGTSINRSAAFRAQLPADGRDVASAIMYQNLEAMSNSLTSLASDIGEKDFREGLRTLTAVQNSLPKVAFVYGEQDRILASAKGSFGLRIASMLSLTHMMEASGMGVGDLFQIH
jgi:hypothetical protein